MNYFKTFSEEFTDEHRVIRDLLLEMITNIIKGNKEASLEILGQLAVITGPHFRFEEESLYPILTRFYGDDYINKLFTDHDLAIGRAFKIKQILTTGSDTSIKWTEALNHVRGLLPHVSDCQGLVIFAEKFEEHEIKKVIETKKRAKKENQDLLVWASNVRKRRYCTF